MLLLLLPSVDVRCVVVVDDVGGCGCGMVAIVVVVGVVGVLVVVDAAVVVVVVVVVGGGIVVVVVVVVGMVCWVCLCGGCVV